MMRCLTAFCMIMTIILPVSQGAVNPEPVLSIRLDTASQNANLTANTSASVRFTGTCAVDKLPIEKVTVELTSSVDRGWVSQVSPTSMVFTSTTPQSFTCTIVVPEGTTGGTFGKLTISGTAATNLLKSTSQTEAVISVEGPAPVNQTANGTNSTQPAGTGPANTTATMVTYGGAQAKFFGLAGEHWAILVVVIVAAVAAAYGYSRSRRNRMDVYEVAGPQ
jgi:hypothetical protein